MRFYDTLQLDPAVIKPKIRAAETKKEKVALAATMAFRSILIVAFATLCIALMGKIFGNENMPMAVALFCILLGIRFVDFNYCIKDSLINFAVVLALLVFAPVLATLAPAPMALLIHFSAFFIILLMSCDKPELGNGGLYNFAYVYLTGNPVTGMALVRRSALALFGFIVCGAILYCKHRKNNPQVRFSQILAQFTLNSEKSRWQLRFAIGVAVVLTLGRVLHVERFMWAGFACASLLSGYPYSADIKGRSWQRILGAIVGSAIFFVLYQIIPASMHTMLGPLGGFCMGFCTDYRYKTATNCLGALMMASSLYGAGGAVCLRVVDTILGVLCSLAVAFLFQKIVDSHFANAVTKVEADVQEAS